MAFLRKTTKTWPVLVLLSWYSEVVQSGLSTIYQIPNLEVLKKMKIALILGIIFAICLKDAAAKEPKSGKSYFMANS